MPTHPDLARSLDAQGATAAAGVGRGAGRTHAPAVRGDRIAWLPDAPGDDAERAAFDWLEAVRVACNRNLLLGLERFEGHYAVYPPGAGYERHRDRFRDDDTRALSCVLYLNDRWRVEEGGSLRLYLHDGTTIDVVPEGGTFIAFLAADFDHEVRPATRERVTLTGWFRRRAIGAC